MELHPFRNGAHQQAGRGAAQPGARREGGAAGAADAREEGGDSGEGDDPIYLMLIILITAGFPLIEDESKDSGQRQRHPPRSRNRSQEQQTQERSLHVSRAAHPAHAAHRRGRLRAIRALLAGQPLIPDGAGAAGGVLT